MILDSKTLINSGPWSHKNGTVQSDPWSLKKLLIPIPWLVIPDPGAVIPESHPSDPDSTPLIPDPTNLVMTLPYWAVVIWSEERILTPAWIARNWITLAFYAYYFFFVAQNIITLSAL